MTETSGRSRPLTKVQREVIAAAQTHPLREVVGDPRTLRSLHDRGLVTTQYAGEDADGPTWRMVLVSDDARPTS